MTFKQTFNLALGLFAISLPVCAQQFALKDNDTVVFYGDSITAQRFYTKLVEEAVLTRYPSLNVQFLNAGVPGDATWGGYAGTMAERVQHDVAPFHPTMITVMLGMNDGGYVPASPKIEAAFQQGYNNLLDALTAAAPDAALTLILPTPYDEITHGTEFPGYSHILDHEAGVVSGIAAQRQATGHTHVMLADFHTPLVAALHQAHTESPQLAPLLIPDRIHPSEPAHWIMAAALLSAWHIDPVVGTVSLDARKGTVATHQKTTITDLQKSDIGLKWTQLDEALPLPLDLNNAMTDLVLHVSDIAALDQQSLQVSNLAGAQYQLLIDSKPIAIFSREQLQHGVNLALYKTPMLDQARGIDWYEDRRGTLDQAHFLLNAEVKVTADTAIAENKLKQAQAEFAATIRTKITPQPHSFELRRQ